MSREATSGVSRRLELAIQLITGAAVLIGAILVILEMQQSRNAAYAQMVQDRFGAIVEERSKIYGETLAPVLARACHDPEALDPVEIVTLDTYFGNSVFQIWRARSLQEVGGFQENISGQVDWRELSLGFLAEIVAYPGGRKWLDTHPVYSNPNSSEVAAFLHSTDWKNQPLGCKELESWLIPSI